MHNLPKYQTKSVLLLMGLSLCDIPVFESSHMMSAMDSLSHGKEKGSDPVWVNLPSPLWSTIFQRLDLLDRLRFRAVCPSFNTVATETQPHRLSRALLLLPPNQENSEIRELYSMSDRNVYKSHLPQLHNKWVCGSSFGFLFTVDFKSGEIGLFNPLSKTQISLPPLSAFTDPPELEGDPIQRNNIGFIEKAIISKDPSTSNDYIVMVIFTYLWTISFFKPGDDKWTNLKRVEGPCEDVICYKNKFYVITNNGALVTWDLSNVDDPKESVIIPTNDEDPYRAYLVESIRGELFKVCRIVERDDKKDEEGNEIGDENYYKTVVFLVYKLDEENKGWFWGCICGQAMFLGYNRGICLSTEENSEFGHHCIYFTDDNAERYFGNPYGCNDVGVFHSNEGNVDKFYQNAPFWTNPCIWVMPNPR